MKKLYTEIREHIKKDFNITAYLYVAVFVAISLFIIYYLDFYQSFLRPLFKTSYTYLGHTLLYSVAYFGTTIPILLIKRQKHKLRQLEFWVKSISFILVMSIVTAFIGYKEWVNNYKTSSYEYVFLIKILSNLKRFLPFVLVLYIIKLIYDRRSGNFYGIGVGSDFSKPLLYLLLLLFPFVFLASFLPDFQAYYPRFKFWTFEPVFGLSRLMMTAIFELIYGLDFISTELLFRGALVVGMSRVLDREAVLCMVSFYVFIHIGKPLGETISSLFGGYILGILAYNHKNISAGIILHLGIAYMMELAAILQYFMSGK